jgi:endoglucanase
VTSSWPIRRVVLLHQTLGPLLFGGSGPFHCALGWLIAGFWGNFDALVFPMKLLCLFLAFFSVLFPACAREAAFALSEKLGRGINLGNVFEAPSEEAWGNPFQPHFLPLMRELGFSHVRVPIRWETPERSLQEAPWTISHGFLIRIQNVVNQAHEEGLHVIINMHHHEAMLRDPEGQRERFLALWRQIATAFAEYPETLLFELFNEPHGLFTAELWNRFAGEALGVIRESNPKRHVLIGTADWGGLQGLKACLGGR